jgi:hypothetical protein
VLFAATVIVPDETGDVVIDAVVDVPGHPEGRVHV